MVNNPTFEMMLPQAKPDAMTASGFQFQDFAGTKYHKSLKNKYLPPPPPVYFHPLSYDLLSPIKSRMIAALILGEPLAAELVAVCTALLSPCQPWESLRVRRYARLLGAVLPNIKATLGGSFAGTSFGSDYSGGKRSVSVRGIRI